MSHNDPKPWASYDYCKNKRKGSVADSFATFDQSLKKIRELINIHNSECNGRCKRTYTQCLTKQGINIKENREFMKRQEQRGLGGLFSRDSSQRISIQKWKYNTNPFGRD